MTKDKKISDLMSKQEFREFFCSDCAYDCMVYSPDDFDWCYYGPNK